MRFEHATLAALAALASACGGYGERYPSYEAIVAQYAPAGPFEGEPLDAASAPDCVPPACPCPRLWYDAHWVYYCDGSWVYWHDDFWYHYPYFYVYYVAGVPYVVDGPTRHITKHAPSGGHGFGEATWPTGGGGPDASQEAHRDFEPAAPAPDRPSKGSQGPTRSPPRRR